MFLDYTVLSSSAEDYPLLLHLVCTYFGDARKPLRHLPAAPYLQRLLVSEKLDVGKHCVSRRCVF
jgi:hypothetical protein